MPHSHATTFAERLAFARLVYHYRTGKSPGNADLGRAVKRTQPWATKWAASDTPPTDYRVHAPLAAFLQVDERWLIRGEGEPPMPDLWTTWRSQRVPPKDVTAEASAAVRRAAPKTSRGR